MATVAQAHQTGDRDGMDEPTRRGLALYEAKLKALLEPQDNGRFVAIHPDTGDYVVADTSGDAMRAMYALHPEGQTLLHAIGPAPADSGLAARMLGTRLMARSQ